MTTLKDSLLPIAYSARAIAGQLGFRPHNVALVIASTTGTHTGDGDRSEVVTAITEADGQPPKVRWLKDEEIALGALPLGTVEVGPVTPSFPGGGTSLSLLDGSSMTAGQVRLLRITGPNHPSGANYTIKGVTAEKALRYVITAVPVGSQA